jgi:tRNA pseudouridine55 synthase
MIDGKRAYELARKGKEVNLKPKVLVIDEIEILYFELPILKIRVVCGKGTYIRALARDIGEYLHSGAYLIALERTRIGNVTVAECINIDEIDDFLDNSFTIK